MCERVWPCLSPRLRASERIARKSYQKALRGRGGVTGSTCESVESRPVPSRQGWEPSRCLEIQMAHDQEARASAGGARCRPLVTLVFRPVARMPPIKHRARDAFYEDVSNEEHHCGAKQVFKHGPSAPPGRYGHRTAWFRPGAKYCDAAVTVRPWGGRPTPSDALDHIPTERKVGSLRRVGALVVTVCGPRVPHGPHPWIDRGHQPGHDRHCSSTLNSRV